MSHPEVKSTKTHLSFPIALPPRFTRSDISGYASGQGASLHQNAVWSAIDLLGPLHQSGKILLCQKKAYELHLRDLQRQFFDLCCAEDPRLTDAIQLNDDFQEMLSMIRSLHYSSN